MEIKTFKAFRETPTSELEQVDNPVESADISEEEILETGEHTTASNFQASANEDTVANESKQEISDTSKTKKSFGKIFTGKFGVKILDLIMPAIVLLALSFVGRQIDKKVLKLSADEREVLEPAVQEWLDSISINFDNPLHNMLFAIAIVYGTKVVDVLPEIRKKNEKPKREKSDTEIVKDIVESVGAEESLTNEQKFEIAFNELVMKHTQRRRQSAKRIKRWLRDSMLETVNGMRRQFKLEPWTVDNFPGTDDEGKRKNKSEENGKFQL